METALLPNEIYEYGPSVPPYVSMNRVGHWDMAWDMYQKLTNQSQYSPSHQSICQQYG